MDSQKVRVRNTTERQSIYTYGLGNQPGRLDLMSLADIEESAPHELIEMVLERKKLPLSLRTNEEQNQLFWNLYSEQKTQEKLKGYRPVGLGYPMIHWQEEGETRAAPAFIWPLRLEPSLYRANGWEIYVSNPDPCRVNARLLQWLNQNGTDHNLDDFPPHPGAGDLSRIIQELSLSLNLDNDSQSLAITPAPDPEQLQALESEKSLLWSGVIGLFPALFVSEETAEAPVSESVPVAGHNFGLLPQDPYQASALAAARSQSLTWVEGLAGTGKTHLLTQIVSMALANSQKCLVVSPSMANLTEIQNKLAKLGVQQLLYLIRNPETETGMLLDFLRAMAEGVRSLPDLDTSQFKIYLDRCEREKRKLDERYAAVRKPVFGPYDWAETVGLYLESNRKVGKELLNMQLYTQDFEFNDSEFLDLSHAISSSYPLYQKVNTLKHDLNELHPNIFLRMEKEEGRVFAADRLEIFHEKCTRLQRRYFAKVNQYGEALRKHYEKHYEELSANLSLLKEKLAEGKNRFGQPFAESTERSLRFYSAFSKTQKEILEARREITTLYDKLREKFDLFGYFDAQAPDLGNRPLDRLTPILTAFEAALEGWQDRHGDVIQDNIQRLNRKTVHPRLHMEEDVEEIEDNLDHLLEELNDSLLYAQRLEHKMLTAPKRQRYLESLIERLETTRRSLGDFNTFYDWRRNWLGLPDSAQKLVRALAKVKPSDWEAAFESWYFYHCLNLAHTPKLPQMDNGLSTFVDSYEKLQPLLLKALKEQWESRRAESVRRLKATDRKRYQLLFGQTQNQQEGAKQIREKWARGLPVISEVLPVLLVGSLGIPYLSAGVNKIYDYVLVDEAHLLQKDQLIKLQQLGRRLVVLSNPRLEALNTRQAWPTDWRNRGVKVFSLEKVHFQRPGNLGNLTDPGASEERTIDAFEIVFEQVGGRYDEESQMNTAEAETLLTLLNRIEKTPQRTFPTVGIACMTAGQRNLINQLLFQIKKQNANGADMIRQLERNGLSVLLTEDLVGRHFDVLILSGVFGVANTRGELTKDVRQLNGPRGRARLHLLMGSANKKIYLLNSIPLSDLEALSNRDSKLESGASDYANYLLYLKAIADEDVNKRLEIVKKRQDRSKGEEEKEENALFSQEVVRELRFYLRDQTIETNYKEEDLNFPILVKGAQETQRPIVVQPDGFFAQSPSTDYVWEYQRRKRLTALGYSFLPIWSVKWWKETSLEARRLAATLINLLEEKEEEKTS